MDGTGLLVSQAMGSRWGGRKSSPISWLPYTPAPCSIGVRSLLLLFLIFRGADREHWGSLWSS